MQFSIQHKLTNLPPIVFVALAVSFLGFCQAYNAEVKCLEIEQHKAEIQQQRVILAQTSGQMQMAPDYSANSHYNEANVLKQRKQAINALAGYSIKKYHNANAAQNVQANDDSFIELDKRQFSSHALELNLD
ncbi:MAG: hypothetical protein ACKVTZ_11170 [Bacteroidia bacterium]